MDTQRRLEPLSGRAWTLLHTLSRSARAHQLFLLVSLLISALFAYSERTSHAQDRARSAHARSETGSAELDAEDRERDDGERDDGERNGENDGEAVDDGQGNDTHGNDAQGNDGDDAEGDDEPEEDEDTGVIRFADEPDVAVQRSRNRFTRSASSRHASLTEGLDCSVCHEASGWQMSSARSAGGGFDHSLTGFPLTGRHDSLACVDCHRERVVVRRECASCHIQDDYHQGRLGRQCDRCHNSQTWNDTQAFEIHRTTRLPLTGVHALLDCTECHLRTTAREYTSVPADCFACHEDDYRNPDVHPVHVGTATSDPFPRDCTLCHIASGFTPAFVNPIALPLTSSLVSAFASPPPDHEARFPISTGVHRDIACSTCHIDPDIPRRIACVDCHAHQRVTLIRQHRGAVATDAMACLSCHPAGTPR